MKHKIIALSVLLIVISIRSIAQVHIEFLEESKSKLFHEIVQQVEDHYRNRDKGRGSGYKQFKRWEYDHSTRLDSTGRVVTVSQRNFNEYLKYMKNALPCSGEK